MKSLVDDEVFSLTIAKLKPHEPVSDVRRRGVRKQQVWKQNEEMNFPIIENLEQIGRELEGKERIVNPRHRKSVFQKELELSTARLEKVKRGVSFSHILQNEPVIKYPKINTDTRLHQVVTQMNKKDDLPKARQISFVAKQNFGSNPTIDLVSHVSISKDPTIRYRQIVKHLTESQIESENDVIDYVNHANERRLRAVTQYYEEICRYGFEKASRNARRASQKSSLRILCHSDWWEDFINYAYQQKVGPKENKFIKQVGKNPNIKPAQYIEWYKAFQSQPTYKRCLELLIWIKKHGQNQKARPIRI